MLPILSDRRGMGKIVQESDLGLLADFNDPWHRNWIEEYVWSSRGQQ